MKFIRVIVVLVALVVLGGVVVVWEGTGLINEGEEAPEFSAKLSSGETISLRDFRGKKHVVLFFYPKDFTPGCTTEVCSFRDHFDELIKYDATILGVSFDGETSHALFSKKYDLPFPLISDTNKSIGRKYGTANRLGGLLPGAKRVTYVIDRRGIVRKVLHHEILISRHVEGVIEALKMLEAERTIVVP